MNSRHGINTKNRDTLRTSTLAYAQESVHILIAVVNGRIELQWQDILGFKVLIDSNSSIYNAKAFLWGLRMHVDEVLSAIPFELKARARSVGLCTQTGV